MKTNLKKYRKSRNFTLEQVAIMANTSKSYVWEIESGKSTPSVTLAYALSSAVGECVEDVFPDSNEYNEHDYFIRSVVKRGK